jgi:2-methylcitrate dehydratase
VLLVRVASTAVATAMLGGTLEQIVNAVSNAWIDGGALRTYRHAPNTGSRKSWAAGDATSRAVRHALFALKNEMGYPSALSAKTWGFQDVLFKGRELTLAQPLGSYVMENVLFKISFRPSSTRRPRWSAPWRCTHRSKTSSRSIERIVIETQEPGVRIIDKTGPLANPADRDHCIQYMVAVPLIFGRLTAADYEDADRHDPRIDCCAARWKCARTPRSRRNTTSATSATSATRCTSTSTTARRSSSMRVDFPVGHRKRAPKACRCWCRSSKPRWPRISAEADRGHQGMFARKDLDRLPVNEFMARWSRTDDDRA